MIELAIGIVILFLMVVIFFIAYNYFIYGQDDKPKNKYLMAAYIAPIYLAGFALMATLQFLKDIPVLGQIVMFLDWFINLFTGYVGTFLLIIFSYLAVVYVIIMAIFVIQGMKKLTLAKKKYVDFEKKQADEDMEAKQAAMVKSNDNADAEVEDDALAEAEQLLEADSDPFADTLRTEEIEDEHGVNEAVVEAAPATPANDWLASLPVVSTDKTDILKLQQMAATAQSGQLSFGHDGALWFTVLLPMNLDALKQLFSQNGLDISQLQPGLFVVFFDENQVRVTGLQQYLDEVK